MITGGLQMKKLSLLCTIMMVMLVGIAFSVHATLTTVETYSKTNPAFGGENQQASNPKHDDASEKNKLATSAISFRNDNPDDDVNITSLRVTPNSPFSETDLAIQFVSTDLNISHNGQKSISFQARIPEELDAIDVNGEAVAFNVATVELLQGTTVVGTFDVFMQRENNLQISNSDATINGREKKSVNDGDKVDNLKPGDVVSIEVEASNEYDDSSNLDVKDITLKIKCDKEKDINFDDKSIDMGDISPGDDNRDTIGLDFDPDAKDDNANCVITIIGKDENGARHGEAISFDMEVKRKSHDVQIPDATATPLSLSCTDKEITLSISIMNLGKSNERHVAVEITSKAIGYQERVSNIELDQDDSTEEVFVAQVDPTKLKAGPFAIQVQTFYDNTRSSNTETVQVENLCNENTETGNSNGNKVPGPVIQGALELDSDNIKIAVAESASIPVKVTNLEKTPVEYMILVADVSEFADTVASKSVFLNPGQQSTVLLNLKAKAKVDAGKYSGVIVLKDSTGKTLETKTFTVDVTTSESGSSFSLNNIFSGADSRVFWIIGDIILIIVAIFFIRLIFTGGKKKQQTKKMADYEAEMSRKRQPGRRR